ncbi:hypothetical protein LZ554_006457 [Drepanopeziza brunnea f. sp. 'monogermtubi']|nr:hypothetical protein LZ554_006457 [Drepanopeziza brunnea f. sp. 'monogermtubi']
MDLQFAVLRNLPTPVLVLSPERTAVLANRAAERILGSRENIQSPGKEILGSGPAEIGIRLLYNRIWNAVLDRLVSAQEQAVSEGNDGPVHGVDAVVTDPTTTGDEKQFRILVSTLTFESGTYFILSFERSVYTERGLNQESNQGTSSSDRIPRILAGVSKDSPEPARNTLQIKKAVFDSHTVAGFILTVDEEFYLTNTKGREVMGSVMGGPEGCDGTLRTRLEIWDENFTRRLDHTEFPGLKLVRAKAPFSNYRCGFIHQVTGERIVTSVDGECLYDEDTGEFLGGLCWCRDLQEYSDFLLDQQQRRLGSHETICNIMPHLVWTTKTDGQADYFSNRWYEFTGLTEGESIGTGFHQAIHPDDLPDLMESWGFQQACGGECDKEVRYRRHDGAYRWMLTRACPLRGADGKILKWYGTSTDIHDLVMARIEAARNKLQMLTVLAHAEVNLFSIDKNKIVTMAEGGLLWGSETDMYDPSNKSSMLGLDAIDVAQKSQEGGIPGYEKNLLDILAGKVGVAQSEDSIGSKVFRTRMVADLEHNAVDGALKPEIKGVLGLSIDVTDMKQRVALELENNRLMIEEQAAKESNETKSRFLANMSHEMRTPTAGVIGMVELLGDDATLTPEQREYVNSIHLSAKALLTIVNDILDFSKIESGRLDIEMVPFYPSSVVGELCKLLGMFASQKGIEFVYENFMDEKIEVLGDPGRTRQVLSNLLTNALKFTKQGAVKLTVTSTLVDLESGEDTLKVQFIIEDTGIGIEKKVLDKLFIPFNQGDSSTARLYGGTGLGLTISRNLANLMKGSIELESTPGVGSKAKFTIPLQVSSWRGDPQLDTSSPPSNPEPRSVPSMRSPSWADPLSHRSINQDLLNQQISSSVTSCYQPPTMSSSPRQASADITRNIKFAHLNPEQRSRFHVLVVEDNAINQTIAIKNIRKLGFPVTAVWNGREALSYLLSPSRLRPRPAIILMDVQMPVMDGYEATRILRTAAEYARDWDEEVGDSTPEPDLAVRSANVIDIGLPDSPLESGARDVGGKERRERICDETRLAGKTLRRRGRGYLRDIPVIAMTASAIQGDREKCYDAGMDDYLAKPVEKARLEEMLVKWASKRRDSGCKI